MSGYRIFPTAMAIAFAVTALGPVAAQQRPAVALTGDVKVVRQVTENGKASEKLEEPTTVLPGDRLLFTTSFRNTGPKPVDEFVVTNPLPAAVKLARTGDFETSVDGGTSFGPLDTRSVTGTDGAVRPAEVGDVTHVRWRIATIAPGATGEVRYLAEVR